jgi:hypothetical protein
VGHPFDDPQITGNSISVVKKTRLFPGAFLQHLLSLSERHLILHAEASRIQPVAVTNERLLMSDSLLKESQRRWRAKLAR